MADLLPPAARYMLLSALGFALMAACVKGAAGYGIPVLEIVAVRALVSLLLSYLDIKRKRLSPWGSNRPLLFARGAVGAVALVCVFYAVSTLPLAQATVLQYTYPAFTAVIALVFLKERIQLATLICIGLSFLGLLVMVWPDLAGTVALLPLVSVAAALLGALGSAAAYVMVRRLSRTDAPSVIIFYFPLVAFPVAMALLGDDFVVPGVEALVLMLLVGVFTQVGQIGLTQAMALENAGKASAYAYVQVIFSALLGWMLFEEVPSAWTLLGGALIIGGALVNTLGKR